MTTADYIGILLVLGFITTLVLCSYYNTPEGEMRTFEIILLIIVLAAAVAILVNFLI